jgi:hypothetical protein
MTVKAYDLVKNLIEDIFGKHDVAAQFASDPYGTMAARGLADADLSDVDVRQAVGEVCDAGYGSPEMREALQGYTSGVGPAAPAHQSVEHVVQQLSYVTNVAYQDDHSIVTTIVDQSTNIDNSTDIDVQGDLEGDISIDNANATGDGAVAGSGHSTVNAATGDHSQVIGGSNFGNANTGDGAVQIGGTAIGGLERGPLLERVVGTEGGAPGGGFGIGPINTGTNTGVMAGGAVDHTIVGDHNLQANVEAPTTNSVLHFGSGDVTNVANSPGAVTAGHGDAVNQIGNVVGPGGALSGHGDALGYNQDDHSAHATTETHVTTVDADHSNVGVADGHSHLTQHADLHQHADVHLPEHRVLEPVHEQSTDPDPGDS